MLFQVCDPRWGHPLDITVGRGISPKNLKKPEFDDKRLASSSPVSVYLGSRGGAKSRKAGFARIRRTSDWRRIPPSEPMHRGDLT
jgi:hypothetical protein